MTIAVPNRGLPTVARATKNGLLQPEVSSSHLEACANPTPIQELHNAGSYSVVASLISPVMNALCVNADRTELEPIVYQNRTNIPGADFEDWSSSAYFAGINTSNYTSLDDVFGWEGIDEDASIQWSNAVHARPSRSCYVVESLRFACVLTIA